MPIALQAFSPTSLIQSLHCDVRWTQQTLHLEYQLVAEFAALHWPPPAAKPQRRMALWEHTCFECFVADSTTTGYTEVNVAPSGDWNCFDFQAYRLGMQASSSASLQSMSAQLDDEHQARIQVELDLPAWSEDFQALQLGLSAVIEDKQGQRHYYALQHIDGNPDFHHRDTHILTITRGIE
jgi:hypothetical protein